MGENALQTPILLQQNTGRVCQIRGELEKQTT
jgi:hypothetical protein